MATMRLNRVIQRIRAAAAQGGAAGLADGDLLDLFLLRRDDAAFAELVRRHGPMVLGVCRRVLKNPHDADDAFQATFLILVRRGDSVRPRGRVGAWLHGVAYRTALEARRAAAKRRLKEAKAAPRIEAPVDVWEELRPALDRELARLPAKYRVPLLACDLEGKTRKEAAAQLGWPEGTVASRLSRARAAGPADDAPRHDPPRRGGARGEGTAGVRAARAGAFHHQSRHEYGGRGRFGPGRRPDTGSHESRAAYEIEDRRGRPADAGGRGRRGRPDVLPENGDAGGAGRRAATPPARRRRSRGASGAGAPAAPEPWGTVQGRVVWAGEDAPTPTPVVMDKDQAVCSKNGPIYKMDYVVNPKNKGVRWAVVWLVDADDYQKALPVHPDRKEVAQKELVLDQPCCQFEPHVVCLREGQTLTARNSGTIPHNTKIDSPGDNPNLNPLIPPGASASVPNWKADWRPSLVSCGIHPWMSAYLRVFDHPYFAVTDEDGQFKIEKAPAGKYRIVAWQESVGYLDKSLKRGDPIEIPPAGVAEVNFPVKPKE